MNPDTPQLKSIDEVPDEVASKLIKMLAVAYDQSGNNQGEVENAMAKARAYAMKHDIDLATIRAEDAASHGTTAAEPFISLDFKCAKGDCRRPPSHKYIESLIVDHFNVRMLRGGSKHRSSTIFFIGRKSDVTIARYVYGFLHNAFTKLWRQYKQRTDALMTERASYYYGLWVGLDAKLSKAAADAKQEAILNLDSSIQEKVNQTYTLIKVEEAELLKRAVKDHHPVVRRASDSLSDGVTWGDAYTDGKAKGADITILTALPSETTTRKKSKGALK